jgi:hypothetical protein
MKQILALLASLIVPAFCDGAEVAPQVKFYTADDLGMPRHKINYSDHRMWLFSGRHRVHAGRWSTTAFSMDGYKFRFDFVERRSGIRIMDNINEDPGDPLGYNFRPGAPYCIVAQDDTWYPHKQVRTGTFHKQFKTGLVSFAIETTTAMGSWPPTRVCLSITLTNRSSEPLALTLLPVQNGKNLLELPVAHRVVSVSSDLTETNGQGFYWTLPPNSTATRHFIIADFDAGKAPSAVGRRDAAAIAAECEKLGQEQISRITSRIPAIKTQSRQLNDLYKRCIASLALCRWEGEGFRRQPTWVVGGAFVCVVSWDFSFAADTMALVDPQGLRNVVQDVLAIGKMRGSYINVHNASCDWVLYLQDPFALQEIISRYITITGDTSILDDRAGDATVYQWLKRWGDKLHNEFMKGPGGLVDVGDNEQLLIEIRTSDYTRAVPVVNGLAVDYFHWLAKLAARRHDPDAAKFTELGDSLKKAMNKYMWNEREAWFDCVLDRGERKPVYTYHLYDILGTDVLSEHQRCGLESHLREGEFLAEYGMYSISRQDTIHWDRQDADFGGGGSYVGMPFRIARNLYEHSRPALGWEILKRMSRLADHFCIMPQSPMGEAPDEDPHGGNMNISCVAGMEAMWSGIFGLRPQEDGTMIINPAPYNPEVGEAELAGYLFRGHRYDVRLAKSEYEVFVDGTLRSRQKYGCATTIRAASAE